MGGIHADSICIDNAVGGVPPMTKEADAWILKPAPVPMWGRLRTCE